VTLPETIYNRITDLSEEGSHLSESGDHLGAIAKWTQALKLVPEPKTGWEASTWLYASIADGCYQLRRYEDARASCFDALNCPAGVANPFIHYRLGQCEERMGNRDGAVDHLLQAYMLDGENIFTSDPDGLQFLSILKERRLI
jgi:tetratricopeptide (TPR) repeat protein